MECLFCGKERKRPYEGSSFKEGLVKCVMQQGELLIKEHARKKQDHSLLGKIDGVDLIAKEARRDYARRGDRRHHTPVDDNESTGERNAAHSDASERVCHYVHMDVVDMVVASNRQEEATASSWNLPNKKTTRLINCAVCRNPRGDRPGYDSDQGLSLIHI